MTNNPQLREELAYLAHERWSDWMRYLFSKSTRNPDGSVTIPPDLVKRWVRQMATNYPNLPENEQKSERREADRVLQVVKGTVP